MADQVVERVKREGPPIPAAVRSIFTGGAAQEAGFYRRAELRPGDLILGPAVIVEDNADARALLETLCRSWGYRVESATNGPDGLARLLELRPYVAVVDIGLPGLDGYELARRARNDPAGKSLTLVALTGFGLPAQRDKALASGFDLHMVKPADPEILAALLDEPA